MGARFYFHGCANCERARIQRWRATLRLLREERGTIRSFGPDYLTLRTSPATGKLFAVTDEVAGLLDDVRHWHAAGTEVVVRYYVGDDRKAKAVRVRPVMPVREIVVVG